LIHPSDYRYEVSELEEYLTPSALLRYQIRIEIAYITALNKLGVCSDDIHKEYVVAESQVHYERVKELEDILKHDIKAMVEALKEKVSPHARIFCHLGLTSSDTVVNAHALVIRDVTSSLLLPSLRKLIEQLIHLARNHLGVVQMGRTHGQHAEPTTFGFVLANYIERLGRGYLRINDASLALRGKLGGAVGTRAGLGLIADPTKLENETLSILGLQRVEAPNQIANQEEIANFYSQLLLVLGTVTDLANDFRQLQRSEIRELFESMSDQQVGSSTMPQKRNPIGWENIISHYKTMTPRLITSYMNIISEHQRDLTDSAANRYLLADFLSTSLYCLNRANDLLQRMEIDEKRMRENIIANQAFELAEPVYILLSLQGVDRAHTIVREMANDTKRSGHSFKEVLQSSDLFRNLMDSIEATKQEVLGDSSKYIGQAIEITETVCDRWERVLKRE
jgi:adenylosuccinate lyase